MTLFWGLVLMAFGLVAWGPLLEAGLTVASLPFGSLLGLFLLGTLNRRSNATGALAGMFAGLLTILCVWRLTTIAFTWYVLIGSCITFLVGSLVSLLTRPAESVDHHATVRSA
jgi:Na+/proline symporter